MNKQPKTVLFEGINNSGKSYLISQFKEAYPKQIEVIKFPHNPDIIEQIEFLYHEIKNFESLRPDELMTYLNIIHNLFDLDFRQFASISNAMADTSKVYFLDRYYPSNLVYAGLHHLPINPYWMTGHSIKPDITILLEVKDGKKYIKDFPMVDNFITLETGGMTDNAIHTDVQLLTAENLWLHGQKFYHETFKSLIDMGKMSNHWTVDALQEDTFRNIEKILMKNEIL